MTRLFAPLRAARPTSRCLTRRFVNSKPSFPFVVLKCPEPTCDCAPTPEMPEGLEIDRTSLITGLVSSYAQAVLICTGKDDWPSRIEDDSSGDNLAAHLKKLVGRGGAYSDPFHSISVLASSFPPSKPRHRRPELQTISAYLLPNFQYIPFAPRVSSEGVEALVKGYLLPERLNPAHDGLSPMHRDRLTRKPECQAAVWGVRDVNEALVLVCGHGGRDQRCGVFGPLLKGEFERQFYRQGVEVLQGAVEVEEDQAGREYSGPGRRAIDGENKGVRLAARVGLISHIGGHKFAGNVIIYLPPHLRTQDGQLHPLAGYGIWYGRVEPRHVEGIVKETVLRGSVIAELLRGGVRQDGHVLRL